MLVKPLLKIKKVIATGAAIRISNSCEFKDGMLYKSHFPTNFCGFSGTRVHPLLLFGRMAWGEINGLLLVSGGLGMFDKETVIEAGGYWHRSLGEDGTHYQNEKINASKKKEVLDNIHSRTSLLD
jgi:hypothetical protein